MKDDYLRKGIGIMVNTINEMKQDLHRLDLLGLQIINTKREFNSNIQTLQNEIFSICQILNFDGTFNFKENSFSVPVLEKAIHSYQESNGFGNHEATQSTDDIIEEVKQMIVELNIKGSVRTRDNGLIEFRSQALGSIYGRTKSEIEQKLTQRLKEAKRKQRDKKKTEFVVPTNFDKFALYWFENFHKRKVKENTYKESLRLYNRHVKNAFGNMAIKAINPILLQAYLDGFSDRPKTADDIHSQLNQIFNAAVKHGVIFINPIGMCFHKQHERKHGSAISKNDEKKLLAAYAGTPFQTYFAVVLYTGLRPNEYKTASIENGFIKAINSKRRGNTVVYKRIPISTMLAPYVASMDELKMPTDIMLMKRLKKVLPNHTLYDMRTTFQTRCTECGISDVAIGLFMGNGIGGALKEAYTDVSDEYLIKEMSKLNY